LEFIGKLRSAPELTDAPTYVVAASVEAVGTVTGTGVGLPPLSCSF